VWVQVPPGPFSRGQQQMRDSVYVVAVVRKDGKLPTSEKMVSGRFFAERREAKQVAENLNGNSQIAQYKVYSAVIEITHESHD